LFGRKGGKVKQENISSLQLFYILNGSQFGSAFILGIGAKAKQDAWIVILVACICSLVLAGIYIKLASLYPSYTLVQILPELFGKFIAFPIIVLYIVYFIYVAARICRNFGELVVSTILVQTPIIVVISIFVLLIVYCLRGGIETLGRMGEIVFPIFVFSLVIVWILLLSTDTFNLGNLSPVLGNGIIPVLKEVFPTYLSFPFAELVIILMFIPFLHTKKNAGKVAIAVILIGGIMFGINAVLILSVLGPEIYLQNYYPFLSATRLISIADFLERFDALIILMMVAGVFFKVGVWTYAAALGISQLCKLNNSKPLFLAIGTILIPLSLLIGDNFVTFLDTGFRYLVTYVHPLMQIIFPSVFLGIGFIKKKFGRNSFASK
jgi:spore germination protein KB